jgi:hypothetical protein
MTTEATGLDPSKPQNSKSVDGPGEIGNIPIRNIAVKPDGTLDSSDPTGPWPCIDER